MQEEEAFKKERAEEATQNNDWEGAPHGGGPVDQGLLKEPTACYFMKA